jgi:hypothetical protein
MAQFSGQDQEAPGPRGNTLTRFGQDSGAREQGLSGFPDRSIPVFAPKPAAVKGRVANNAR